MATSALSPTPQTLASLEASGRASDEKRMPVTPSTEDGKDMAAVEDVTQPLENTEINGSTITKAMRRKGWIQFAILCMSIYVAGWNDGTTGPLLPRLQEVYHVGYTVVALIFIVSCIGFISGASSYLYLTDRFGFGAMVVAASFIMAIGNSLQASGGPFPVFVIAYFFAGFGEAFLDAGSNAFVAGLNEDTSLKMGIMHAIYGVGAMCAPLVSTQFARLPRWSFVYLVHVGLVIINAIFQVLVFKFRSQEDCLKEIGQRPHEKTEDSLQGMNKYKQVFRLRAVHLMAVFLFTYVGVEVTIGGWIVTFVINERNGGANSGYISSGFWAGLTIGRLALLPINKRLGEWRVIFLYILLSLALELVVWLVPSLVGDAVAISFVGFFLGPIFPIVMNHAGSILPPELISGAIGWMASIAAAGAAVFPFITGAIASGTSINSLQPLLVAMMGLMLVIWAFVPRHRIKST